MYPYSVPPPPPPQHPQRRNSPFAILGVLVLVLGVVGVVALAGQVSMTRAVAGTATAAPGLSGSVFAPPDLPPSAPSGQRPPPSQTAEDDAFSPLLADGITLPETTCELPGLGGAPERFRAYFEAAVSCLDRAWQSALATADARFDEAGLVFELGSETECGPVPGEDKATAFYCPAEAVIYLPRTRMLDHVGLYENGHLALLAHEYGHHIQNVGGIMFDVADEYPDLDQESPEGLEVTRRMELQADCFAGLFLASVAGHGSVSHAEAEAGVEGLGSGPGSETHGTAENQARWTRTGFDVATTAACDTWLVPDEEVA